MTDEIELQIEMSALMSKVRKMIDGERDQASLQLEYLKDLSKEAGLFGEWHLLSYSYEPYFVATQMKEDETLMVRFISESYPELSEHPYIEPIARQSALAIAAALLSQIKEEYLPLYEQTYNAFYHHTYQA